MRGTASLHPGGTTPGRSGRRRQGISPSQGSMRKPTTGRARRLRFISIVANVATKMPCPYLAAKPTEQRTAACFNTAA